MTENLVPNSNEGESVTEHHHDGMVPSWSHSSSAETTISNEYKEEISLVEDCDESDDESDDGNTGNSPSSRWFVCPCFRPKPKKVALYNRLYDDRHQQSFVDPIITSSSYEAPLEKMTRRPSNESITDSETEEESCSSYSCSDDENDVISEYCAPRQVRFGNVEIREYAIVIGDHLSPKQYPICLDWAHAEPETISVDDHEHEVNHRQHKRMYGSNIAFWLTPSAVCKNSNVKKGTESFRLSDPRLRFDRLCAIMALSKEDLCALEVARISKFIENRRRVTVGLPPI